MAAPFVTGSILLLWSLAPEYNNIEIINLITSSASKINIENSHEIKTGSKVDLEKAIVALFK